MMNLPLFGNRPASLNIFADVGPVSSHMALSSALALVIAAPCSAPGRSLSETTIDDFGIVLSGQHCGGPSISTWADGTSANYGSGTDLTECMATCLAPYSARPSLLYRSTASALVAAH